ncbi:hypothetical protein ADL22_01090 [Streptomyces sp. NRRL F-4489]|nr:hypothetical protein ADL22_01090 [Streptomyces sp. NRRL F-4489]
MCLAHRLHPLSVSSPGPAGPGEGCHGSVVDFDEAGAVGQADAIALPSGSTGVLEDGEGSDTALRRGLDGEVAGGSGAGAMPNMSALAVTVPMAALTVR